MMVSDYDVDPPSGAELSDDEMDEATGGSGEWVGENGCTGRDVCAWLAGKWVCHWIHNN